MALTISSQRTGRRLRDSMMQFDTFQKTGKDGMEAALKSFSALSRGAQSAAVEAADFAKRSFEQGTSAFEKLLGARTLDRAVEIQSEYAKASYEGLVAQASKMGELATSTAREALSPMETLAARNTAAS